MYTRVSLKQSLIYIPHGCETCSNRIPSMDLFLQSISMQLTLFMATCQCKVSKVIDVQKSDSKCERKHAVGAAWVGV